MQLSRVKEIIRKALDNAKLIPAPATGEGSEILVAACPGGEGWASQYYLALRHSGVRASRTSCIEAAVHILPYSRGDETVVAFTGLPRDPHLAHLAQASSALGVRLIAYGPELHPAYSDVFAELGVEYNAVKGLEGLVALLIAPLYWVPRPWEARRARMDSELKELESAVEWVKERYDDAIRALASTGAYAGYTPSTEAGVMLLRRVQGVDARPLSDIGGLRGNTVVAFYASAEEHAYKQYLLNARLRGVRLVEAMINTDPLTAPLYVAIAGLLASPGQRGPGEGALPY